MQDNQTQDVALALGLEQEEVLPEMLLDEIGKAYYKHYRFIKVPIAREAKAYSMMLVRYRRKDGAYYEDSLSAHGGLTVCIIELKDGKTHTGVSVCSPRDKFSYSYGRNKAFSRALAAMFSEKHVLCPEIALLNTSRAFGEKKGVITITVDLSWKDALITAYGDMKFVVPVDMHNNVHYCYLQQFTTQEDFLHEEVVNLITRH